MPQTQTQLSEVPGRWTVRPGKIPAMLVTTVALTAMTLTGWGVAAVGWYWFQLQLADEICVGWRDGEVSAVEPGACQ